MNREAVNLWLDRYVEAWKSYDPQAISDLFSEDAEYSISPWDEPFKGREAIVAYWTKEPDAAGSWEADYRAYAADGDRAVAIGTTRFLGDQRAKVVKQYHNVFVLRFDQEGRCSSFGELYMEKPKT
jgi:ketosteroid isomerase-like protein